MNKLIKKIIYHANRFTDRTNGRVVIEGSTLTQAELNYIAEGRHIGICPMCNCKTAISLIHEFDIICATGHCRYQGTSKTLNVRTTIVRAKNI